VDSEGNPNKFRLNPFGGGVPLYTTPQPQREWVGLTDDEVTQQVGDSQVLRDVVRAVEHVLKEKNYE